MEKQVNTEISKEERNWAMFCHLAALAVFVMPYIGGLVGPLIVWLIKRNEFPLVDEQGKRSLNFQLTMIILAVIVGVLGAAVAIGGTVASGVSSKEPPIFVFIGWFGMFFVLGFLGLLDLIAVIIASVKVSNGERYRYPFSLRFIK
jgi:uncharacterized protein